MFRRCLSPSRASRPVRRVLAPVAALALASAAGFAAPQTRASRPAATPAPGVLTTAAEVHDLPAALANTHLPVHLTATVTYYDPAQYTLFVSDRSGSTFVATAHTRPVHRGDLVRIDGVTQASFKTVVAPGAQITVLGHAPAEAARVPGLRTYPELNASRWDCQYVSIRGLVRSAVVEDHGVEHVLELEILMPGGLVQGYVLNYAGIDPHRLLDAGIQFSGVVGGFFNAHQQLMRTVLYATGASDLQVITPPAVRPATLPLTSLDAVMQTRFTVDQSPPVRVRGIVTFYRPGHSIVIQNGDLSLYASTREAAPLSLDTVVDLVGFAAEGQYGPSLEEAHIVPSGQTGHIEATPVTYAQALSGRFSDNFVAIRGRLLSQFHMEGSDTLSLMVDNHPVTAVLQEARDNPGLPRLRIGSLISVRGVCRMVGTGIWTSPGTAPLLFQIDLRYPGDVKLIHAPSWWTVGHVLVLFGALAALSLLVTAWAILLRRKVAEQTACLAYTTHLEQERSRILHEVNSPTSLEELLRDICRSFGSLSPGLCCCCTIDTVRDGQDVGFEPVWCGDPPSHVLFETSLADPQGRSIGRFLAGRLGRKPLSSQEMELVTIAAGLANIAVNQRRLYQELNYSSSHDQLTALPNRRSADSSLDAALERALGGGSRVAVAYIDIDRFKEVNDQHGHKIGDLYLQQIARRLSSVVRSTDKLARIGGDEFLLVANGLHSREDAEAYRTRLEGCFANSFALEGRRLCGSASIGIAVYPDHGTSAEELKRHADIDMYAAKHRRRNADHRSDGPVETAIFSLADLQEALASERFELFYQPQFCSAGRLCGMEALLRLNDPILGTVTPDAFLSVAERHEFIIPLGLWVLRQALSHALGWQLHQLPGVCMVVNVSLCELEHPGYADAVLAALREAGYPPSHLELEITERSIRRDVPRAEQQIAALRAAGVRIAVDDFGTEYTSLSTLHSLPIDTLKVDRSFTHALRSDPGVMRTIEALVALGHAMQKRVVIEGIETEKEVGALLQLGGVHLQGFFLAAPQSAADITANLAAWTIGRTDPGRTSGNSQCAHPDFRREGRLH